MRNPIILLSLLAGASSVSAVTLLDFDFDTANPGYVYAYSYQNTGTSSNNNGNPFPVVGAGVGGTAGALATFDTTLMTGSNAGFGVGLGGGPQNASAIATATSLSDFSFRVAAKADGLTGSSAIIRYEIKFEAPDGTVGPTNNQTDVLLTLSLFGSLTSSYSTLATNLGAWTVDNGSFTQVQTFLGALNNINLNFANDSTVGATMPDFGNDNNNSISVDNYLLTIIPEPSGLALSALGLLGLSARRKRSM